MNYHYKVLDDWNLGKIGDRTVHWSLYFPNFGMCMIDPKNQYAYIPIPRCGSQFFCNFLEGKHKWAGNHILIHQNFIQKLSLWKKEYTTEPKYFAIVRDPLERYISALWCLYDPEKEQLRQHRMASKTQIDHLFSEPSLNDHHTINQYNFFYNVDMNQVAFFNYNDKDMGKKISHYFENNLKIQFLPEQWIGKSSENKEVITKLLDDNPKYMENIKKYLEEDYNFLSTIKYYEPN